MSPWHYDHGWHITGTVGAIGATVTSSLLTHSAGDVDGMERAITIAANMTLGDREAFGSMIKSFHPGKAASNGVLAAKLGAFGTTGPEDFLGRNGGYFTVLSPRHQASILNAEFGAKWQLLDNTFKPYPCGIVCHPAIDCAVALSPEVKGKTAEVAAINIYCHPLVEELTGNQNPITGLQARFSTIHGVVAGLSDGKAGLEQYSDSRVNSSDLKRLRSVARLVVEPNLSRDSARVDVELMDGTKISKQVAHARGSMARPLTSSELDAKVHGLVEPVLPGSTVIITNNVMGLTAADNLESLMKSLVGTSA
jgi:2-methylcitrate dehydratase PrpD